MIARSKPNVDYNFLWECICGKGQQIDNTISIRGVKRNAIN